MRFTLNNKDNFFKDFDKAYIEPPKKSIIYKIWCMDFKKSRKKRYNDTKTFGMVS